MFTAQQAAIMEGFLPPVGRNDQESQMPSSPLSAQEENHFNDAMAYVPVGDEVGDEEIDKPAENLVVDEPESNLSLIEATQYVALEVDTQAETQIVDLPAAPLATPAAGQAAIETTDNATSQDAGQEENKCIDSAYNVELPARSAGLIQSKYPTADSRRSLTFIERPIINDAADLADGFKFAPPSKPPRVRQPPKVPQLAFNVKISAAAISKTVLESGCELESPISQAVTERLPSQSKHDTSSLQYLPQNHHLNQKSTAPTSQVPGQDPAHMIGQGGIVRTATSESFRSKPHQALAQQMAYLQHESSYPIIENASVHTSTTDGAPSSSLMLPQDPEHELANQLPQPLNQAGRLPSPRLNQMQAWPQESGHQNTNKRAPLAQSPAILNGPSGRKKTSNRRLTKVPFPEASDFSAVPRDGPITDQSKTSHLFMLPAENFEPSPSGVLPSRIRKENPESSVRQVYMAPKAGHLPAGGFMAAHLHETPAQRIDQLAGSVQNNGVVLGSQNISPELPPCDALQHTGVDQRFSATHPLQCSHQQEQEHASVTTEVSQSPALFPGELTETPPHTDEEIDYRQVKSNNTEEFELPQHEVGDPEGVAWGRIPEILRQKEYGHPDDQKFLHEGSRTSFMAYAEERPDSRRSDRNRTSTRPNSRRSNRSQLSTRPVRQGNINSRVPSSQKDRAAVSKVMKSASSQNESTAAPRVKKALHQYQEFLQKGQEFQEILAATCEEQQQLINTQKSNIKELQQSNNISEQQAEALKTENDILSLRVKKYADMGSKYKKHMNDVVIAQKKLTAEAAQIKFCREEAELRAQKEAAILAKIELALKDARDMRVPAEKFQALTNRIKGLKHEIEGLSTVRKQNERLEQVNKRLQQDNNGFKVALDAASKMEESLKAEVQQKAQDLACEARYKEQLEKQLEGQLEIYRELVEQLKQLPDTISEQLQNEDGILAKILCAENSTNSKIGEVSSLVKEMRGDDPKTPASLVELIEEAFCRLENREQISDAGMASFKEATTENLEKLKATLRQLYIDEDTKTAYNDRISKLEKANHTLTVDKIAREQETQKLTKEREEIRRELTEYQDQLKTREAELSSARAVPKEDPRMKARVQELESAKNSVEAQLTSVNHELSKAKDEVKSTRQVAVRKDEQIKVIEQKYNHAQKTIKDFNEERDQYMAAKEQENKIACQDLAKKAESQKETLRVTLESQVNNAKQKYEEKELERLQVKQKLQEAQAQLDAQNNRTGIYEGQRDEYIQTTKEQKAQVEHLIERASSQKMPSKFSQELQSITVATKECRSIFDLAAKQLPQIVQAATEDQRRIETKIRKVGVLEMENSELEKKNLALYKQIEELTGVGSRPQQISSRAEWPQQSPNTAANTSPAAPNIHQKMIKSQKKINVVPKGNSSNKISRILRPATQHAEDKTSLQSTSTGQSFAPFSRPNGVGTPQVLPNSIVDSSRSAGSNISQYQAPSSQHPRHSIRPFATLASSSSLSDIESFGMIDFPVSDEANETVVVQKNSTATHQGTSAAQSKSNSMRTRNRHSSEVRKDPSPNKSQQQRKVSFSEAISHPSSNVSRHTKSAIKYNQNPHLDEETLLVEATARKEDLPRSLPRPTFGIDHIRGIRSGNGTEPSDTMSQSTKQHPTAQFEEQISPLLGPPNRYQNTKRPLQDLDSNDARKLATSAQQLKLSGSQVSKFPGPTIGKKRTPSVLRTKPRTGSVDIPDSQDRRKAF